MRQNNIKKFRTILPTARRLKGAAKRPMYRELVDKRRPAQAEKLRISTNSKPIGIG